MLNIFFIFIFLYFIFYIYYFIVSYYQNENINKMINKLDKQT